MGRIEVTCDSCQTTLKLKDASSLGKHVRCPKCGEKFTARAADDGAELAEPELDDDEFRPDLRSVRMRPAGQRPSSGAPRIRASRKTARGSAGGLGRWVYGAVGSGALFVVALVAWALWPQDRGGNSSSNDAPAEGTPVSTAAATVTSPAAGQAVSQAIPNPFQKPPDWLVSDAPFDVTSFWVEIPPEQNAAPLYLEAFYEFHPIAEAFFPPEVRAKLTPEIQRREFRCKTLHAAWSPKGPNDSAERDAVLAEHASGFDKLARAQERPRCCFEYPVDAGSLSRIVAPAWRIQRVARFDVAREIERGHIDLASRRIAQGLRLSRDLRVRAPDVVQGVAWGIEIDCLTFIGSCLRSPHVTAESCDGLLGVLDGHMAALQQQDPYLTAARCDYMRARLLLKSLLERSGEFVDEKWRTAYGGQYDTPAAAFFETATVASLAKLCAEDSQPAVPAALGDSSVTLIFQALGPAQLTYQERFLSAQYQALDAARNKPPRGRFAALEELLANTKPDLPKPTASQTQEQYTADLTAKIKSGEVDFPLVRIFANSGVQRDYWGGPQFSNLHEPTHRSASRALVALRKWQFAHREPPAALADLFPGVQREKLPWDPYADEPLRLMTFADDTIAQGLYSNRTFTAGETVIYSLGFDGVDDRARKLAFQWREQGDIAFRIAGWD